MTQRSEDDDEETPGVVERASKAAKAVHDVACRLGHVRAGAPGPSWLHKFLFSRSHGGPLVGGRRLRGGRGGTFVTVVSQRGCVSWAKDTLRREFALDASKAVQEGLDA